MQPKRRDAILDAALTAFASKGFDGTGLREIAKAAGVAQPTIHYHFDTKEKLFEEVVQRGAERSVRLRLERLEALGADDTPVILEDIVRILFHIYNVKPEKASRADYDFNQFVVRFGFTDNDYARRVVQTPFNTMAFEFIAAMMKTDDGFTRESAARAYLWSLPAGMMAIAQEKARFARLADSPQDTVFSFDMLIDFICVGMRSLCQDQSDEKQK